MIEELVEQYLHWLITSFPKFPYPAFLSFSLHCKITSHLVMTNGWALKPLLCVGSEVQAE